MVGTRNTQGRARGGRWRGTAVVVLLLVVLLPTGCLTPRGGSRPPQEFVPAHDPLRGGPPIQPMSKPEVPTLGTPTAGTNSSTNNPAAMASGSSQPLDPSRSLQIGAPQPAPSGNGGDKDWKGPAVIGNGPTNPTPPPPPTARSAAPFGPTSFSPSSGGRVSTYEQAQSILASKNVTWQRLETWGEEGEWKFSCSIPNPQNARIRRTYEARAAEPIAAVRAVIDQIDKDRR